MDHHHHLLLLLLLSIPTSIKSLQSPYLSPSIFFPSYYQMLQHFKIFIYTNQSSSLPSLTPPSLFHTSLLNSPFTTTNGDKAHLFYLQFPPNSSYKAISNMIKDLETEYPFWNRSLGADHFYVSCNGVNYVADRNLVELKKNSIQISCFPLQEGGVGRFQFIPHKDITLPPASLNYGDDSSVITPIYQYIGYLQHSHNTSMDIRFIEEVRKDSVFFVHNVEADVEKLLSSKFCLFFYGDHSISKIGKALRYGCVPVVITDRPIKLDLPFMDVLKWTEFTVFLEAREGVEGMKKVLNHTCKGGKYEKMRAMAMKASKHFVWNSWSSPQPYDAFHTILYQLWLRRHAIRYGRREIVNIQDALSALANNYI